MPAAPVVAAEVLRSGGRAVVEAFIDTGSTVEPVQLAAGSGSTVTVDRGTIWRRSLDAVLAPGTDPALLQPRGHRMRVRRGVLAPDGRRFVADLGVFRLTGYDRDLRSGGWRVAGRSLEYELDRSPFLTPRTIEGPSAVQEVRKLVVEAVPDAYFSARVTSDAPVPTVVHDRDRWRAIDGADESICRAIGAELYCAGDGTFVLADQPDLAGPPAFSVDEGQALVDWREEASEDGVHNVVVATGDRVDGDGPLPYGVWWDDNRYSATYVGDTLNAILAGTTTLEEVLEAGAFGARGFGASVRFYSSPVLLTNQQAASAARTLGRSSLGVQKTVSFAAVVNPWADAGDVVDVRGERHLIERLAIPVTDLSAPMTADTRSQPA